MEKRTCHAQRIEAPAAFVRNNEKQIPLPSRRSKLWSALRMRDRDYILGAFFISLLG
jgi:hypothetical protein